MVVLCCILVVTGFLPSPISRSSLSSPPSQVGDDIRAPVILGDYFINHEIRIPSLTNQDFMESIL